MTTETGGAAFPGPQAKVMIPPHMALHAHDIQVQHNGMTLLDYLAGQALAGMCVDDGNADFDGWNVDGIAFHAYRIASAMLTERAKRAGGGT